MLSEVLVEIKWESPARMRFQTRGSKRNERWLLDLTWGTRQSGEPHPLHVEHWQKWSNQYAYGRVLGLMVGFGILWEG